jgi:lipopolysaccharide transport system ATP-binding protein
MIKIENGNLFFPIQNINSHSIEKYIYKTFNLSANRKEEDKFFHALRNINIEIPDGSKIGIIGKNGAGKTTLLRVLSKVYKLDSGYLKIQGKVNSLTDFTLGMDPNATGLKNIIFRLVFMGFSMSTAKKSVDEIVDFSGLNEFINMPFRTYSTGMQLRLAFAISTHFRPDILILDEIVGAGDEDFKNKAIQRIESMIQESRILILTSHDLSALNKYCTRGILLNKGEVVVDGTMEKAIEHYLTPNDQMK